MAIFLKTQPPKTEEELLKRCQSMEGYTFAQLSLELGLSIPLNPNQRKGFIGQAIELFLGTESGNKSMPDFASLGIELKTLPLSSTGKTSESTFVTSIPLLTIHEQVWKKSQCYAKLKRLLWIPIEGDKTIDYPKRRIGSGFIWSPTLEQEAILEQDWTYLSSQISTGQLETLDAKMGQYLQVRPKAADAKALCFGYDKEGNKIKTLPRGFYLRSSFTQLLLKEAKTQL